jgi:hypothetical protein
MRSFVHVIAAQNNLMAQQRAAAERMGRQSRSRALRGRRARA